MALSRVTVWSSGDTLTAAALNAEFQNIIDNASSLISPLGGALDWDGFAHTLDAAGVTTAQSTSSIGWSFTPGSKSGTPSTTGGISNWAASTWTDSATAGSGTATAWAAHAFQRPTLAASNSSVTTTDAATVYIANSPLAGSNQTLTNHWALWVDAGSVRFDDNITWLSGTSFKGTLDHANSADRTYTFPNYDGTMATVAGTETFTNKTLSGAVVSGAAPASPTANVLYTDSVVKGWVETSGGGSWTIDDDLNVSSITDSGTGVADVNWATAFANANYAAVAVPFSSGSVVCKVSSKSATVLRVDTFDTTTGNLTDPNTGICVIAIGDQ